MLNNRLDRILYIQQVLVQGGVLNKQQTADRFGVSEKTIQRDLDTLRNHFADSEPRREILYNSAKGGYLLDDTLSRFPIVEMIELPDHPFYVGIQAHPEFKSRPNHAHPLFAGFVESAEEQGVLRRAKKLLMKRNHLSEPEAHRYLQKTSMDTGRTMAESAHMVTMLIQED